MEIRHLRYFVVLAEELHFGRAAQRLHMAQPPLSQRIRDLERELSVRLFDRGRRGVTLTEAGALLLAHARPVLDGVESAREAIRRIRPGAAGILRAGVPPDTVPDTIQTVATAFARDVPDVLLELHELTTDEQIARLREGDLDIGVIRHPADWVGLASGPMMSCPLGVVLPAGHPAATAATIRLGDLNGSPLVIFQRVMAPRLYDHILTICRDNGFVPGAIRHARNPQFTHGLVLAGLGVHLNSEPRYALPDGLVWRPIDEERLAWRSSVVWVPSHASDVLRAFGDAALAGLRTGGHLPVGSA
jgi:DNA-binding transcriptional LysR family regulator